MVAICVGLHLKCRVEWEQINNEREGDEDAANGADDLINIGVTKFLIKWREKLLESYWHWIFRQWLSVWLAVV